ncbi:caspase family protein [Lusitaniella coriacea LEGE 07157]|uniref:Caspase family protein n=1 Tax=Lusitaniella coriacea LEGE 07157 TaxID=945747 RepID=A0A8J7DYF8_9CYAN|nr:caspase family protein [Lusitaniella coriacea]MBE9115991.1 caspase family protein [Lusitaniella coriacea LEGE 07157]
MDRYALVIGISQYQSATLSPLPKAAMDAENVAQLLEKRGNFRVERLPRVWNRSQNRFEVGDLPVTRTEVIDALKTLLLKCATNSEALIYFSGHGFKIYDELDEQQGFLAASDTQIEGSGDRATRQQNGISLEFLDRVIKKCQIARLVMLLDCCHSGEAIARESLQKTLAEFSRGADYYLIAACRNFEIARSLKGQPHSIFTGALLAGLAPENADSEGNITGDRLFDYIQQRLKGSRQQPVRLGGGRSIALVNYPQQESRATIPFQQENPYLGLQAFDLEQAMYFHGRDRAIRALRERLLDNRFLAVIGASGCGKSSLVKAGLIYSLKNSPLLDSSDWEIATLNPGDSPLERLIETLAPLHDRAKPFLLFVDQFEEIFTLCKDDEQRKSFFRLMQEEATTIERQGRVIVAIRGDFLDRCAEYQEVASLINRTQPTTYFVEPLSLEELQRAIAQPATQHGVTFDPGLISKMAEDVFSHPGALPLLQYALRELWHVCIEETKTPQPHLTWQGYEQIGKVGGALDKSANSIYNSLSSDAQQACVRRLFLELVELGEGETVTRRRVTKESLNAVTDSSEQLEKLLGQLAKHRLLFVTTDKKGRDEFITYVEVTHEALLSKWEMLKKWIEENRDAIRLKRRFEADFLEWRDRYNRSEEALLGGLRLSDVVEWRRETHPRLSEESEAFIEASLAQREREQQEKLAAAEAKAKAEEERAKEAEARALAELEMKVEAEKRAEAEQGRTQEAEARVKVQKRATISAIAAGVVVACLLGAGGTLYTQKAASDAAAIGFLIGKAKQLLETGNQLEALIASVEALREIEKTRKQNSEEFRRIKSIVAQIKEVNRLQHNSVLSSVDFSPDGKFIMSGDRDGQIWLRSPEGKLHKKITGQQAHKKPIWGIEFSPDNQTIVSASSDTTIKVWDKNLTLKKILKHSASLYDIKFHPLNTNFIASTSADGKIIIWDIEEGRPIREAPPQQAILNLDFNHDGSKIAFTSASEVKIWNLSSDEIEPIGSHRQASSVKFNPAKHNILASSSLYGNKIKIWDLEKGSHQTIVMSDEDSSHGLDFSSNGEKIVSAGVYQGIKVWSLSNLKMIENLKGHKDEIMSAKFHPTDPEGEVLISASEDKTIRIWRIDNQEKLKQLNLTTLMNYSCDRLKEYVKNQEKFKEEKQKINKICTI